MGVSLSSAQCPPGGRAFRVIDNVGDSSRRLYFAGGSNPVSRVEGSNSCNGQHTPPLAASIPIAGRGGGVALLSGQRTSTGIGS